MEMGLLEVIEVPIGLPVAVVELEMQEYLGKPVTILRETVDGERRSLPLVELRKRSEDSPTLIDLDDWGACGCFVDEI